MKAKKKLDKTERDYRKDKIEKPWLVRGKVVYSNLLLMIDVIG